MKTSDDALTNRQLRSIAIWGVVGWIGLVVALKLASMDDRPHEFPRRGSAMSAVAAIIAWLFAVTVCVLSLRIRGTGIKFQFWRLIALLPAMSLAVVPMLPLLMMVALEILR